MMRMQNQQKLKSSRLRQELEKITGLWILIHKPL